jgi:ABC-type sugar transport system ATPase subunit
MSEAGAAAAGVEATGREARALLDVRGIGISFGGLKAVQDFSLSLPPGALYGLIGPNGAGKTTVFNLLTGVYTPDVGGILVDGRDVTGLKPHEIAAAGLARTFQNIRLFGELSVLENVRMGAQMRQPRGMFARGLEVIAVLDQRRAQRAHGRVLLHAVATGDDYGGGDAVTRGGERDRLPVIAASRAHHAGGPLCAAREIAEVHQPSAHLECADRGVILVLDPHFGPQRFAQQRPAVLRRRRHDLVHGLCGGIELGEAGQVDHRTLHATTNRAIHRARAAPTRWKPTKRGTFGT